jgi:hypothetical protein
MDDTRRRATELPFPFIGIERRHAQRYYVTIPIEFPGGTGTTAM